MRLFARKPRAPRPEAAPGAGRWVTSILGLRGIERRVIANLPSWQEYSQQKLKDAQERKEESRLELPAHRVEVSSPLHSNFTYLLIVAAVLALAYGSPTWASYLVYGAIVTVFAVGLLATLRDGVFFHLEGHRLQVDAQMINRRSSSEEPESPPPAGEAKSGILNALTRRQNTVFRSRLMQIHYQNILRTFEAGARRAWVYQDASIADIQTLVSQRGMKLAWTLIEVLPQLGLLGTLVGLLQMFQAFKTTGDAAQLSILAGFGTALGATILANLFVLVLRPLHMRNERSMNEILSSLQMLMAMFILPTQQFALDRSQQQPSAQPAAPAYTSPATPAAERRLAESVDALGRTLAEFTAAHRSLDSGHLAQQTSQIAQEVRQALRGVREAFDPHMLEGQQRAFTQLTQGMQALAGKLDQVRTPPPAPASPPPEQSRVEHDLLQLRLLTRDTLVLLERISGQLPAAGPGDTLLSSQPRVRSAAFAEPEPQSNGANGHAKVTAAAAAQKAPQPPGPAGDPARVRLFKERP